MRLAGFMTVAAVVLAGCVMPPKPQDMPQDTPAQDAGCGAGSMQGLVGQPRAALAGMRFAVPVRIIPPNGRVTMDYAPSRLNIALDGAGLITKVSCG